MNQTAESSVVASAWKRTKERWPGYILIQLEFFIIPIILAVLITILSVSLLPMLGLLVSADSRVGIQIISAVAAVLIPGLFIIFAFYRVFIGSVASIKIIIDDNYDRGVTIRESKELLSPYLNFISLLTMIDIGFILFMPLTLLFLGLCMYVWNQFALFSFIQDEKKGAINIWKGVLVYKLNILETSGSTLLLLLLGLFIGNMGTIYQFTTRRSHFTADIIGLQILSFLLTLSYQIFSIAFLYELYNRSRKPVNVTVPKLWLTFSILGWLIGLMLFGALLAFVASHPIHIPFNPHP